jgi:hypothetical protein
MRAESQAREAACLGKIEAEEAASKGEAEEVTVFV